MLSGLLSCVGGGRMRLGGENARLEALSAGCNLESKRGASLFVNPLLNAQ